MIACGKKVRNKMTLDEAIQRAEEVANLCEYEASRYDMTDAYESHMACKEGECGEEHRQLAEWLKELKQLMEQTRWIPVSERLPEYPGVYMTTLDYGKHGLATGARYYHGKYFKWMNECVIAWMPLPEPYKAERRIKK